VQYARNVRAYPRDGILAAEQRDGQDMVTRAQSSGGIGSLGLDHRPATFGCGRAARVVESGVGGGRGDI